MVYTPLIEIGDFLGHLRVGSGGSYLPLLGYLVEGIHVRLVSGHLLLKSLQRDGHQEDKYTLRICEGKNSSLLM